MALKTAPNGEKRQEFPWGSITWLHSGNGRGLGKLNLGIVTVYGETSQGAHNHYADEQILYGLEGVSKHVVNGDEKLLSPGDWLYIPAYANHDIINASSQSARFLFVASPVWQPEEDITTLPGNQTIGENYAGYFLSQTNLKEVQDKFASATGLGVGLVDPAGVRMTEPINLPSFCHYCARHHGSCHLLATAGTEDRGLEWVKCEYGLIVARLPVRVQGTNVMYVLCGFALLARSEQTEKNKAKQLAETTGWDARELLQSYMDIPLVTRNRLFAAAELLRVTAFSLANLFLAAAKESEIQDYRWRLLQEQQERVLVEADLQKTKIRLIEAQVNPHFLFNTLNTIAQSAVLQGAATTAELVYALSELLRFSLRKVGTFVTLREELQYIENYLYIQRQRFGEKFAFLVDVPRKLREITLPAVTLQPLVENAFVHGFASPEAKDGRLMIVVRQRRQLVDVTISDNGSGMTPERLLQVQDSLVDTGISPPGTGIRGVYWRLKHYCGSQANLDIHSTLGKGTTVTVIFPLAKHCREPFKQKCK